MAVEPIDPNKVKNRLTGNPRFIQSGHGGSLSELLEIL
jgi:hypothetical protein